VSKQHFAVLDGLRGVAAFYVAFHHLNSYSHGYLAVDFFFMLSGFVIAFSYEDQLLHGTMSFAQFLARRFIRLYPLIALGTVAGFLAYYVRTLMLHDHSVHLIDFLAIAGSGLLMLPTLNAVPVGEQNALFPFNSPEWSLFIEILANMAYAAALRFLSMRVLVGLLSVFIAAAALVALQQDTYGAGFDYTDFSFGFLRTAAPITIGVIIYRLYQSGTLPRWSLHPAFLAALFVALMAVPKLSGQAEVYYALVCTFVLFPTIVVLGINMKPSGGILKVCRIGGDLSYPLYMMHGPIEQVMRGVSKFFSPDALNWRFFVPVLALCLIGAYGTLKLYDEPVRAYLTNALRRPVFKTVRQEIP
jgi:peptidoglycan/LPS O-acetylase OafA/YrhL